MKSMSTCTTSCCRWLVVWFLLPSSWVRLRLVGLLITMFSCEQLFIAAFFPSPRGCSTIRYQVVISSVIRAASPLRRLTCRLRREEGEEEKERTRKKERLREWVRGSLRMEASWLMPEKLVVEDRCSQRSSADDFFSFLLLDSVVVSLSWIFVGLITFIPLHACVWCEFFG